MGVNSAVVERHEVGIAGDYILNSAWSRSTPCFLNIWPGQLGVSSAVVERYEVGIAGDYILSLGEDQANACSM